MALGGQAGWSWIGNVDDFLQKVTNAAASGVYGAVSFLLVNGRKIGSPNFVDSPSVVFAVDNNGNVSATASAAAPGTFIDGGTY